ncbi:MAG TPA: hypothetical protein VFC56_15870, partial [Stellaceae bacterium]|nr:hypothetical protein [Stellaceae bacterium]
AGSFNSVAARSTTGFAGPPSTFSGGTLQNGTLTTTVNGSPVTLGPLTPGAQTAVSGQGPFGPVSGTAFLTSDSSYFYASLSGGGQVALIQGGIPITNPATRVGTPNQVLAFNVQQDPALGSTIPFIRGSAGGNIPGATVSPLYLVTPSGSLLLDPAGTTTSRTLQASLGINGTGPGQQSVLVASIGFINDAAPQLIGSLRGTSLLSSTGNPLLITSGVNSIADGVGGGLYGRSGLSGIALGSNAAAETPLSGAATPYNFNHPAVATATPAGVGPGLSGISASFIPSSGYFGGMMFSNQAAPYIITGTNQFNQTGAATFSANFFSDPLPAGPANGLTSINFTFGGQPGATPNSTIIDGNIYGATEGSGGATLFDTNGSQTSGTQQLYLISGAAAPLPNSIIAGGNLCSGCAYSQWGYWGGGVQSNFGGGNRIDLGNINFFVAGQPTVVLPTLGTGTYSGNAVGAANNNGAQYIASGTFNTAYDFGAKFGTFNLTFDGRSLIASPGVSGSTAGVYTGALVDLATHGSGFTGNVTGRFFGPLNGAGVPPETGGNFSFQSNVGTFYSAGGVFLGKGP